eukprot:364002-Chlamydomonas_euryale.AAC.7
MRSYAYTESGGVSEGGWEGVWEGGLGERCEGAREEGGRQGGRGLRNGRGRTESRAGAPAEACNVASWTVH